MYTGASAAFYQELKSNSRIEHIRGTIGNVNFTDENIISMNYTNRASDTKEVSFGLAYVGQLQMSLCDVNIPRGSWSNKQITVEFGLTIGNAVEWIPVGIFFVSEALWTDTAINITANDAMTKFDKNVSITTTEGDIYSLLSWACSQVSVTFGMTQADCERLPNGDEYLGLYPESDVKTYRDFIGWVSQTAGGFATIDRQGRLVVRSWADSLNAVDIFTASDRIAGSAFSDFQTHYSGISIVNIEEKTTSVYDSGDGVIINLGSNPFMQYGTDETKTRQREVLMNVAQDINWTPFSTSILSNPVYDLGDKITMSGGVAGQNSLSCVVMDINWTPKGLTEFRGYGSDPALAAAKSKTDKNISGITGGGTNPADKITIVSFANAEETSINSDWQTFCHMRIGIMESQTVQCNGVVKMTLTEPGTVFIRYVLNSEPLPFIHVCQFPIGVDTVTLFLPIAMTNDEVNDLKIQIMSSDGATGLIDLGDAQVTLQGAGVTTGNWDGYIDETVDTYAFPFRAGLGFAYTESLSFEDTTSEDIPASDSYAFPFQAGLGFAYVETERTGITMMSVFYYIQTEDGEDLIVTEDGVDSIITET